MMDDNMPPEVTIEPADNGFVVRHYRKSSKKDESGKSVRQVAATADEALGHARKVLGGGKNHKKKSSRDGHSNIEAGEQASAPAAHSGMWHRAGIHRRRPRSAGRRA